MLPYTTEDKDLESMHPNLNRNSSLNNIPQEENGNPLQKFKDAAKCYRRYQSFPGVQEAWDALVMSISDPLNYLCDINSSYRYDMLNTITAQHKEEDLFAQFNKICDEAQSKVDTCNIDTSAAYQVDGIFTTQRLLQSDTKTHHTKQKKHPKKGMKGSTHLETIYHHYRHLPHVEAAWQKQHHDSLRKEDLLKLLGEETSKELTRLQTEPLSSLQFHPMDLLEAFRAESLVIYNQLITQINNVTPQGFQNIQKHITYRKEATKNSRTILHAAALYELNKLISLAIQSGNNPNAADSNGYTPLLIALRTGNPDTLLLLLKLGADPNKTNKKDRTPIYTAIYQDNVDAIRSLVKFGAKVNTEDCEGLSPLDYALKAGNYLIIQTLIEYKARSTISDKIGSTPLHMLAQKTDLRTFEFLLLAGEEFNPYLKDRQGKTPIDYVIPSHKPYFIKAIEKHAHNKNSNLDTRVPEPTHAQVTSTPYGTAQSTIFDDNRKRRHLTGERDANNIPIKAPRWPVPSQ